MKYETQQHVNTVNPQKKMNADNIVYGIELQRNQKKNLMKNNTFMFVTILKL